MYVCLSVNLPACIHDNFWGNWLIGLAFIGTLFCSIKRKHTSSLTSHFRPTVLVLSIKNGFYKIKKSIFRSNYARHEKMLTSKIFHLKIIYKFDFDHFLVKCTVFVLIEKMLKIKNCSFRSNYAIYEKMLRNKIVGLKKILQFCIGYFLIG